MSLIIQLTLGGKLILLGLNFFKNFSHSSITPLLFKKMKMKYLVLNRINSRYKHKMRGSNDMEFYWGGLLVHVLYDHYNPPFYLDFERDGEIFDDIDLENRSKILIKRLEELKKSYSTNNLLYIFVNKF
jgi:hypothetical protein